MIKKLGFLLATTALARFFLFPLPAQAATIYFEFDFRATSGYVTDPAYGVPVLAEIYPHTYTNANSAAVSAGWVSSGGSAPCGGGTIQTRNRSTSAPVLAGINFPDSSAISYQCTFEIILPHTGSWTIGGAFGDGYGGNAATPQVQVLDNATSIVSWGPTSVGATSFADINGTVETATNWPSTNTTLTHTFASTTLNIVCGSATPSSDDCQAATIYLIDNGGGGVVRHRASVINR